MISQLTTLVLGAGASRPYGYPSGPGLVRRIIDNLSREIGAFPNHYAELMELGYQQDCIRGFVRDLNDSGVTSIDEFLECRSEFRPIGKTAIAQVISRCEAEHADKDPLFRVNSNEEVQKPRWYPLLMRALGPSLETLADNRLRIVTFNYDRSLEHYLYNALLAKHGSGAETQIIRALNNFRFIHVHGKLGNLHWEQLENVRRYGERKMGEDLRQAGELISIVYEGDNQRDNFTQAQMLMSESERVIFLGFGYHSANLKRLGIRQLKQKKRVITGTRFGLTDLEVHNLTRHCPELRGLRDVPDISIHEFLRKGVILDGALTVHHLQSGLY